MGHIPNKTYTAPDGSVYRVEPDGSVTQIKGGRVQSNEPPSKYNITPDGKIYRVESDGSVTYLGNAEERQYSPHFSPTTNIKKSNHKWACVIILAVIVAVAMGIYVANQNYSTYDKNYYSSSEQYSSNAEASYIVDGDFYGTIGNTRIHGNLTLDTENPFGVLYYSDNGNGEALEIYGTSDGKTWSEYYNGKYTGRIDFYFWDLSYKNFAKGTYTRHLDGKRFSVELYKYKF